MHDGLSREVFSCAPLPKLHRSHFANQIPDTGRVLCFSFLASVLNCRGIERPVGKIENGKEREATAPASLEDSQFMTHCPNNEATAPVRPIAQLKVRGEEIAMYITLLTGCVRFLIYWGSRATRVQVAKKQVLKCSSTPSTPTLEASDPDQGVLIEFHPLPLLRTYTSWSLRLALSHE